MQPPPIRPDSSPALVRPSSVRWRVLAWLCSLAAITYVGRIGIIQVLENIQSSLHLTPASIAYAFSAFSLAYALFEIPVGWFGDRLGARKILIRIGLCWVVFTAFTGAAWNLASLVVIRFLFGAGEAGAFPNIGRASREWFPFAERGLAQGYIWMFARWGGAIAPLLMMLLAHPLGWRPGFVFLSVIGILWMLGFSRHFRNTPAEDPRVNSAERALIGERSKDSDATAPLSWKTMLASPSLWSLSTMYFCSNAGWSFFT